MKKKPLIVAILLIVILAAVGVLLLNGNNSSESPTSSKGLPSTVVEAKKTLTSNSPTCLVKNEQIKQGDDDPIAGPLAMSVVSQLIDVPAGTNVDVRIATLSDTTATGASVYPNDYGTYNFTAQKDASKPDGWKITQFTACKK